VRLFEYQAKDLFRRYSIPVPEGKLAHDPQEVLLDFQELGPKVVVKAQILAGGRGKAGGISLVSSPEDAQKEASRILSMSISGEKVSLLLIEEAIPHEKEFYLSVALDRGNRTFAVIASKEGGVEVEGLTGKVVHDIPLEGLTLSIAKSIVEELQLKGPVGEDVAIVMIRLEKLSRSEECELAEINPLAITTDGTVVALDGKVILDDNALFRHPEFSSIQPEDPLEAEAARQGFAFVRLEGDIAVIGNGAGLVLSTLDLLTDAGGKPACFLDLGGGAQRDRVEAALRLVNKLPEVDKILVNIFGGITRTTDVAEGLREAIVGGVVKPIYARISGAEEERAKEILSATRVNMFPSVMEAIRLVVKSK
jgi:succinyl-CoA synthetase beta subunit